MIYRALLDGVVRDEPQGWDTLIDSFKRDYNLRGIVSTKDGQFVFQGDGYRYLNDLALNSSGTSKVDLIIERSDDDGNSFVEDYKGTIFIADCEFNEGTREARCKIQDDSYYARINNNKSIGVFLYGSRSKNNVAITPCTVYTIKYFTVTTGAYITQTFNGGYEGSAFKSFDVLRYMIEWMTDKNVGFASSIFDTGGELENWMVTHGRAIQLADQAAPGSAPCDQTVWETNWDKVKWDDVLKNHSNRFNLWWTIEYTTGVPVFRLEKESYFRGTDTVHYAFDVDTIKTKINSALFYAKVQFGQGEMLEEQGTNFPETIDFVGWKDEEFQLLGESNLDATLDLRTTWVTSSNVIEYLLFNGTASDQHYDRMILMVECEFDSGVNYLAVKSDFLDTGFYYYNFGSTNAQIASRFLGAVPQSIATFLGAGNDEFQASSTTDQSSVSLVLNMEPFPFDDSTTNPNFDTSNNYDNATYQYIIPQSGVFTFTFDINVFISALASYAQFGVSFVRYDSFGIGVNPALALHQAYFNEFYPVGNSNVTGSSTFVANAGDKITVRISSIFASRTTVLSGSTFSCTKSSTGGGIYNTYDYNAFPAFIHEINLEMSNKEYKDILASKGSLSEFAMANQQTRKGWFDMIKLNQGRAVIQLSSTKNIN